MDGLWVELGDESGRGRVLVAPVVRCAAEFDEALHLVEGKRVHDPLRGVEHPEEIVHFEIMNVVAGRVDLDHRYRPIPEDHADEFVSSP